VGGVFGAGGIVALIVLLAVVLRIVRYRSNRQLERELDEKVAEEVRAGTPMFGMGKEDDGLSIMGGRASGLSDPEKAYGGAYPQAGVGVGYGAANTAAYATYGGAAAQPAFYSPNSSNNAPRRYMSYQSSQYNNDGNNGHERTDSLGSARSYGSYNQPPMNAFAHNLNAPSAPLGNGAFASATFAANYGEYRHPSPAPSTQSWQSRNQTFGARAGMPSALTPGGGLAVPGPGPTLPRGVYTPLGARPDSPAVLGHLSSSNSPQSSRDAQGAYSADTYLSRQVSRTGGLTAPVQGPEPPSPNVALPNPFDERDKEE